MASFTQRDLDYDYLMDDDSDVDRASSSEDEIDFTIHCANQRGMRVRHTSVSSKGSSAESDFEKEMNEELNQRVSALEEARKSGVTGQKEKGNEYTGDNSKPGVSGSSQKPSADEGGVYIDSDEEEMITSGDEKKRRKDEKLSNDDLFYDPDLDDEDQKWVDNHRRTHFMKGSKSSKKLPTSDAVLDCPACMTTLCLDCQKHEVYHNQYRAMFVMNCHVDFSEVLKQPPQKMNSRKRKSQQGSKEESGLGQGQKESSQEEEEKLHPVRCVECNTVVGVFDTEEIYHFFNVLAGH